MLAGLLAWNPLRSGCRWTAPSPTLLCPVQLACYRASVCVCVHWAPFCSGLGQGVQGGAGPAGEFCSTAEGPGPDREGQRVRAVGLWLWSPKTTTAGAAQLPTVKNWGPGQPFCFASNCLL